jgi:tetratricopeptide (TPR) repeat protein
LPGALVILGVSAASAQPVRPPGSSASARFYLKRGEDFSGAREYDRAIADYTTAIGLKPDYAEAYNDRGFAYYLKGDAERAISVKRCTGTAAGAEPVNKANRMSGITA